MESNIYADKNYKKCMGIIVNVAYPSRIKWTVVPNQYVVGICIKCDNKFTLRYRSPPPFNMRPKKESNIFFITNQECTEYNIEIGRKMILSKICINCIKFI